MDTATWKVSPTTARLVTELQNELAAEVETLRDWHADMSETWQQSERGTNVGAWLEGLQDLVDTLEDLDTEV